VALRNKLRPPHGNCARREGTARSTKVPRRLLTTAPTSRHAPPRVRASSCETFISLITASGRQRPAGPAATVAHELVGLLLAAAAAALPALCDLIVSCLLVFLLVFEA
jgi:hypothetical protein